MANTLYERTIAFAGLCQSVKLVQDVARTGTANYDAVQTCLKSITVINPSSTVAVFEHEANLKLGLTALIDELNNSADGNELTRYLINLLALERKLKSRRDSLAQLGDRISNTERQLQMFDLMDEQMLRNFANIYLDTISPLGPRVQISGSPTYLQNSAVQNKIRALLLAGIRAAVLWRQVGGKRRHLIFSRKQMIEQAKLILARNS